MRSLLLLPFAFTALVACQKPPVISTSSGRLHGTTISTSKKSLSINAYLGVPYALPPTGASGRFLPPRSLPPSARNNKVNATKFGYTCPQFPGPVPIIGLPSPATPEREDCLNLNVWVPHVAGEKAKKGKGRDLKPVMVWIYGGAFWIGATSWSLYNPTGLLTDEPDVIVVSMNYRLGILGFPDSKALRKETQRNAGIRDQRLALEWIRDNIEAFGGDPKRITTFGESAGGISIDLHSYAYRDDPIAAGYIMQSGQVELLRTLTPPAGTSDWKSAAKAVGCINDQDAQKELRCMQGKNITDIQAVLLEAKLGGGVPIEDGVIVLEHEKYHKLNNEGKMAKVPTLLGNTHNEGDGLGLVEPPINGAPANYTASDALTEQGFTCPAARAAAARAAAKIPVWRYRWMPTFPTTQTAPWIRAAHGSELPFVFGTPAPLKPYEREAEKIVHKVWTAFARNPTSGLDKLGWKRFSSKENTLVEMFTNNLPRIEFVPGDKFDKNCTMKYD